MTLASAGREEYSYKIIKYLENNGVLINEQYTTKIRTRRVGVFFLDLFKNKRFNFAIYTFTRHYRVKSQSK